MFSGKLTKMRAKARTNFIDYLVAASYYAKNLFAVWLKVPWSRSGIWPDKEVFLLMPFAMFMVATFYIFYQQPAVFPSLIYCILLISIGQEKFGNVWIFYSKKMNLTEELLKEHSKANSMVIANYIDNDQDLFDELMVLFLGADYRISQRAAMVLGHCAEKYPGLIKKHLKSMVQNLRNDVNDAVKRNTVRVLQFIEIPDDLAGTTTDICFNILRSHKEPIAVKAFSMTVLFNLTKQYPELADELRMTIDDMLPYGSAGIVSRGNAVLKDLRKLKVR